MRPALDEAPANGLPSLDDADIQRLERKMDHIVTAVFGNPLDRDDHGLVGELRETRAMVGTKLDKLFHSVLGLAGALMAISVAIALNIH